MAPAATLPMHTLHCVLSDHHLTSPNVHAIQNWSPPNSPPSIISTHTVIYTRVPVQRTTDDHCFGAEYNPYVKMLDAPLTMMAEFNDVRLQGSEPIEWFVQVAIKVKDFPAQTSRPAPNARPAPIVGPMMRPIPGAVSQHIVKDVGHPDQQRSA